MILCKILAMCKKICYTVRKWGVIDMSWLRKIFTKYEELITYVIFGTLATVVDWSVYIPLYNWVQWPDVLAPWSATISKASGWLAAMLFAFFTNKMFVFKSRSWSVNVAGPEFLKFLSCRIGSGLFDMLAIMITVDILGWNGNIMVVIIAVIVALFNYFGTKFLFKKKKMDDCL